MPLELLQGAHATPERSDNSFCVTELDPSPSHRLDGHSYLLHRLQRPFCNRQHTCLENAALHALLSYLVSRDLDQCLHKRSDVAKWFMHRVYRALSSTKRDCAPQSVASQGFEPPIC